ncbi:hypothetical protein BH18ACT17_BH18ACT17_08950 [soil metagenome]
MTDPGETGGPFDIRRVDAASAGSDRIELTVRFWPGFTVASVPLGPAYDRRRHVPSEVEGAPDGDFTDGTYNQEGFFFRRDGRIWFRNGEFGSSPCCWTTRRAPRPFDPARALHPLVGSAGRGRQPHRDPIPGRDQIVHG